jgi:hypothetical protein
MLCAALVPPGVRSRKSWGLRSALFIAPPKRVPKSAAGIVERASGRVTMPSNPAKPFLVSREDDPQLQRLNENIERLAAVKPAGDAFGAFALAAHLADLAIEAALELGQMPRRRHESPAADHQVLESGTRPVQSRCLGVCRSESLACGRAGCLPTFEKYRRRGRLKTMQIEQPCTSVESIKQLRQAQVPDAVIVVMLRRGKERA